VTFTYQQSQRLFLEHFARRLLIAHGRDRDFTCDAHSDAKSLAKAVWATIGVDGGVLPFAMAHGCLDCTHVKQYASAANQGADLGGEADVVGSEAGPAGDASIF
jgi:hypothetical protein